MPEAFHLALAAAGGPPPQECILLDDAAHNLRAARALGFYTIRVGSPAVDGCCDAAVASLRDLPAVLGPLLAPPEAK